MQHQAPAAVVPLEPLVPLVPLAKRPPREAVPRVAY